MNSPAIGGRLTATDISFAYHPGAAVLNGATLDIPAGAFLGIVGPNGAGKSTLLHLLSGAGNAGTLPGALRWCRRRSRTLFPIASAKSS